MPQAKALERRDVGGPRPHLRPGTFAGGTSVRCLLQMRDNAPWRSVQAHRPIGSLSVSRHPFRSIRRSVLSLLISLSCHPAGQAARVSEPAHKAVLALHGRSGNVLGRCRASPARRPCVRDGGGWGSRPGLRQAAPPPAQPRSSIPIIVLTCSGKQRPQGGRFGCRHCGGVHGGADHTPPIRFRPICGLR